MSATELKAALSLSAVFFSTHAALIHALTGAKPGRRVIPGLQRRSYWVLALGIYGLTQASLQIPFGMLSDRFGRKPIICLGLIIFIIGSLIAAMSDSSLWLDLGSGITRGWRYSGGNNGLWQLISAPNSIAPRSWPCIGISIGISFSVAFVIGPLLYNYIGINGLFYLGICLAILAILTLLIMVPNPPDTTEQKR